MVCFELIKEGGEAFHIICDSGGLLNVEHLARKLIALITTKVLMEQST